MKVSLRVGTVVFLLTLLFAGCGGATDSSSGGESAGGQSGSGSAASQAPELRTIIIATSGGEEVEVRAEIADDEAERQRGLMGRTALGEDRGMLFVFDGEQELSFWMRGTLIPLSIAYMDSEGRILDIQDMEALDDEPPHYISSEPAMYALEVNEGFFDGRGVEVGDRAELPG